MNDGRMKKTNNGRKEVEERENSSMDKGIKSNITERGEKVAIQGGERVGNCEEKGSQLDLLLKLLCLSLSLIMQSLKTLLGHTLPLQLQPPLLALHRLLLLF